MFFILSAIFLWSSLGIVIRLSDIPVHILIFFSCLISTVIIGPVFMREKYRRLIPRGRGFLSFIILGPLSLLNTFSFFYAYKNTTIANSVLTHYTAPIFVAFLAPIFLRERLTGKIVLSVTIATAGLWTLLDVSVSGFVSMAVTGNRDTGGILAGLFSGFAYGMLVILIRIFAQNYHPMIMTFFQNLVVAALLVPFVGMERGYSSAPWAFGVMGIVHSTIAPLLYFRGMRVVTANRAAILGYLEPVCAIIFGAIFLGEVITYKTVIGGALILFSGYLTIRD
ncbi:MAG TPA: DMT family transporter [Thermodesulfovibrionales bacterium]|nr:DMT family transporter [Thermodesulfovibrionales bacterium]